jgi:hypothetical protein
MDLFLASNKISDLFCPKRVLNKLSRNFRIFTVSTIYFKFLNFMTTWIGSILPSIILF